MKKMVIAGAALVSLAVPAAAADLPLKAPPRAVVAAYDWNGFYAGVNVGYSWGRAETDPRATEQVQVFRGVPPVLPVLADTGVVGAGLGIARADVNGVIGGLQAGWNWQRGTWLFGLETDFQWSGEHGSSAVAFTIPALVVPQAGGTVPALAGALTADTRLKWFGTLRPRAGVLVTDRWLLYVTGGLAYGRLDSTYTAGLTGFGAFASTVSTTKAGWTVGVGAEGALWGNWTAKVEYLYMDLGSVTGGGIAGTVTASNVPAIGFSTVTTVTAAPTTKFTDNIFRVGLNYRFAH